ncbi:MAG TPA: ABC transporter permease subunit, partial [Solirubrobacteraceae bacterium]|nr:ABC transporter permease subunit [Solirubrobacteraceae bacterium]
MAILAALQLHNYRGGTCESTNGFCPSWIADHLDRYRTPFIEHVELTLTAVALGFLVSFALGMLAHRRRWLVTPVTVVTGVLFTVPSVAAFYLLLPITGRGFKTAEIALTSYMLLIIFRNVTSGLAGASPDAVDAARGLGLTDGQVLWRIELPLALPTIFAGLRVAATTAVSLATLAFFAGAGGLGGQIYADLNFKSNVVVAGGLCVLLAVVL